MGKSIENKYFKASIQDNLAVISFKTETINQISCKKETLRFMEACDDLCTDISGNVWMTGAG